MNIIKRSKEKRFYKRWIPKFFWSKILLFLCIIQTICLIVIESILTYYLKNEPILKINGFTSDITNELTSVLIYHYVFLAAQLFSLIICLDAVNHKNTIQAISFMVFNWCLVIYSIIQYFQYERIQNLNIWVNYGSTLTLDILIIVISATCSITYTVLVWVLFNEFGWIIFKKLGADLRIRKMFKHYQILITLLQLEIFFYIGYSVQLSTLVLNGDDIETWIQIAVAIPFSVFVLGLAFFSVTNNI